MMTIALHTGFPESYDIRYYAKSKSCYFAPIQSHQQLKMQVCMVFETSCALAHVHACVYCKICIPTDLSRKLVVNIICG